MLQLIYALKKHNNWRFPTPSQPRIFFLFERAIQLLHCFLKGQPLVKFVCGRKFCYGKEQNCWGNPIIVHLSALQCVVKNVSHHISADPNLGSFIDKNDI
jgi:hypothetical protein